MKRVHVILLHITLLSLTLITLLPLLWMLSVSFMATAESTGAHPPFWPAEPTLVQYQSLFQRLDLVRYIINSFMIAGLLTFFSVLINAMAGYAFAKLRIAGKNRLFNLLLTVMVIPGQAAMFPLFLMLKGFGLINTLAGVIIPGMASLFGIFMVRSFALSIPDSILDAARLDGAGEFRIFYHIVLPLCRPVLSSLALFTFLGSWNDFMWPLIVLTGDEHYTLPVALANLMGEHGEDTELMMAGAVLTTLPVILIFLILQRFYMAGLMTGSLKE